MCQENIKTDAQKHTKINGKTMLDLCLTNDANIVANGFKIGVEREPTNDEKYGKMYFKKMQKNMSEKMAPPWGLSTPRDPKELFSKFSKK